ncbi:hypothetical protein [Campylobacter cuniculorum]|uniref:hypothetical protein n=1 Tax=Campylobacter cuniculorum TaxID=374106 RepID=UPI0023F16932|nr:hypothetical protein [Campylobacter cuniculorum]
MKIGKKVLFSLTLIGALSFADAVSIDDLTQSLKDNVLKSLDKKFDGLFNEGLNYSEACFGLDTDINLNDVDFCSLADEIDKMKINTCSLFGGNGQKDLSLSGARSFCKDKVRKFEDYASKKSIDIIEYSTLNADENNDYKSKLPNGKTLKQFYSDWDINNVLKKDSVVSSYLKNGNMQAVSVFMDYAKTSNKDLSELKVEDLSAPATLEDYRKGIDENIKSYRNSLTGTNQSSVSSLVRAKIQSGSDETQSSKEVLKTMKKEFDLAKNAEISLALSNSDYKKIPIPTQEYVLGLRKDLQPAAIAQIRKQQAYESAEIAKIEDKWNKKYENAKLIAEKEVIMAQKFDEESAKNEIEKLISDIK